MPSVALLPVVHDVSSKHRCEDSPIRWLRPSHIIASVGGSGKYIEGYFDGDYEVPRATGGGPFFGAVVPPSLVQELGGAGQLGAGFVRSASVAAGPGPAGELLRPPGPEYGRGGAASLYAERYADEPFVELVDEPPGVRDVRDTNVCRMHVSLDAAGRALVFAAIDNLWKGAAGQAIQNLNLMLGLPESGGTG